MEKGTLNLNLMDANEFACHKQADVD